MAKVREIACAFYECEGGVCAKRGCECHFNKEMQKCQKYEKATGAKPRRTDHRKELKEKQERREFFK